eukprot:GHVT01047422.1.p1 GENE.GHVT01047422.1~~GHVT01047422.1.p1  ORF type:complete len:526 (-),score=62.92 GHVT01047422.1:25-1602(-)
MPKQALASNSNQLSQGDEDLIVVTTNGKPLENIEGPPCAASGTAATQRDDEHPLLRETLEDTILKDTPGLAASEVAALKPWIAAAKVGEATIAAAARQPSTDVTKALAATEAAGSVVLKLEAVPNVSAKSKLRVLQSFLRHSTVLFEASSVYTASETKIMRRALELRGKGFRPYASYHRHTSLNSASPSSLYTSSFAKKIEFQEFEAWVEAVYPSDLASVRLYDMYDSCESIAQGQMPPTGLDDIAFGLTGNNASLIVDREAEGSEDAARSPGSFIDSRLTSSPSWYREFCRDVLTLESKTVYESSGGSSALKFAQSLPPVMATTTLKPSAKFLRNNAPSGMMEGASKALLKNLAGKRGVLGGSFIRLFNYLFPYHGDRSYSYLTEIQANYWFQKSPIHLDCRNAAIKQQMKPGTKFVNMQDTDFVKCAKAGAKGLENLVDVLTVKARSPEFLDWVNESEDCLKLLPTMVKLVAIRATDKQFYSLPPASDRKPNQTAVTATAEQDLFPFYHALTRWAKDQTPQAN